VNVLIYAPLLVWLWKVPYDGHQRTRADRASEARTRRHTHDPAPGLGQPHHLLDDPARRVSSFFVGNAFQAQMPEYAHDLGSDDAGARYSILLGANAAGALIGGIDPREPWAAAGQAADAIVFTLLWLRRDRGFRRGDQLPGRRRADVRRGFLNLAYSSMSQTLVHCMRPRSCAAASSACTTPRTTAWRAFSGITVASWAASSASTGRSRSRRSRCSRRVGAVGLLDAPGRQALALDVARQLELRDRVAVHLVGPVGEAQRA